MREMPKIGDRICTVRMDGCMADVRGAERWGTVKRLESRPVYGSLTQVPMALLALDSGGDAWEVVADACRSGDHFERQI